jgi:hypothetical protein
VPLKEQTVAFARKITRYEFGRFYWDQLRQREVQRSLDTAKARIKQERRARAKLEKRKKRLLESSTTLPQRNSRKSKP